MPVKLTRITGSAASAAAALLVLSACATNEAQGGGNETAGSLQGTLNGVGSSAMGTAQSVWIAGLQNAHRNVTVNYDPQGSGAGRKAFLSGGADFAGTDSAFSPEEIAQGSAACAPGGDIVNLPVYLSPIAITYNLPEVTELKLDAATLAGIFKGDVTTWNAPEIAEHNSGVTLPDTPIVVVHRSDDSGTTENFTDYLAANASEVWGEKASQTFPFAVGDAAKGTSGVAAAARTAAGSISYLDASAAGDLQKVALKVGTGYSELSTEGAAAVVAGSPIEHGRGDGDLAVTIDRTFSQKGAWPLVLVSYLGVCTDYADDATGELVSEYLSHVVSDEGQDAAAEAAGSAPLAPSLAETVRTTVEAIE